MENIFRTEVVIYLGVFFVIVYIIVIGRTKGFKALELENILAVFVSGSSIMGSSKLIFNTIVSAHLIQQNTIETDELYIIGGGFCVIWISIKSLYKKIKS